MKRLTIFSASAMMLLAVVTSSFATTYYVKPDGNDSNPGLSDAQAWKTIEKVNNFAFSAGDDVYFKCGGTWTTTNPLVVDWSGTGETAVIYTASQSGTGTIITTKSSHGFANGATITIEGTKDYNGTYSISDVTTTTFTIPKTYVPADGPGQGGLLGFARKSLNRVIIGAYYDNGVIGLSGNRPKFDASYATGLNDYSGAIDIYGSYVTIENIEVYNQRRRGINCKNHSTVSNCVIHKIYTAAIVMSGNTTGCIVEQNDVYDTARDEWEPNDYSGNSSATISSANNTNYIFRYNTIHEGYGEGHIHDYKSDGGLIEYNTFYDNKQINLYVSMSRNATVRYNLCYNTANSTFMEQTSPSSGIEVAWEPNPSVLDSSYHGGYDIYGNFIANCGTGIMLWGGLNVDPINFAVTDINIFNNTIVASWENAINVQQRFSNLIVRNNIFLGANTIASVNINSYGASTNVVFDYNLWSSQPTSVARGSNDPQYSSPQLAKTSGWSSLTPGGLDVSAFQLTSTSPALGFYDPIYSTLVRCNISSLISNSITLLKHNSGTLIIGADANATAYIPPSGPVISNAAPTGGQSASVTLSATTDVSSTCRAAILQATAYGACADIPYLSHPYVMSGTTSHSYPLNLSGVVTQSLTARNACFKCSDAQFNIGESSSTFYYPPNTIFVSHSGSGDGLTYSTPAVDTTSLANIVDDTTVCLIGDTISLDFSGTSAGVTRASITGTGSLASLIGKAGLTFYANGWTPSALSTMQANVHFGSRILPLMNWSGANGTVLNNTIFMGDGSFSSINMSALPSPGSCYVTPRSPHGSLSFTSKNLGPCTDTCTDARVCGKGYTNNLLDFLTK